MKTLVFTVEGKYARFRCAHTTTSALSYTVFHPIAIKGLIGAIMGIDYKELYNYTTNMRIGIQVLKPVYKDMQSFNLVPQSGGNGAARFQSRVEFLRDVKYRIFLSDDEEKLKEIEKVLNSHQYVFTPYLGCSEHIAKLNFETLCETVLIDVSNTKNESTCVDSVIPKNNLVFNEEDEFKLYMDRIPIKNDKNREYIEYSKIVFSSSEQIQVKDCDIYAVDKYKVFMF
jgi:CRISPR-associated protein Cas5h